MGSHQKMTEYERRRLENIKRNSEMLAALKIQSKFNDLAAVSAKRERAQCKTYKRSPVKKPKTETPVVLRRSLRTRGVAPDASTAGGITDDLDRKPAQLNSISAPRISPLEKGPVAMRDVCSGDNKLDHKLREIISGCSRKIKREADARFCDNLEKSEKFETFKDDKLDHKLREIISGCSRKIKCEADAHSCDNLKKSEKFETFKDDKLDHKLREIISGCSRKIKREADAHSCDNLEKSEKFETFKDDKLDHKLREIISGCSRKIKREADAHSCDNLEKSEKFETFKAIKRLQASVDMEALQLKSENIARVVPGRIMSLRFFPTLDMQMIVVGNKSGDIGFWNVNGKQEDGDGIYLYHPHTAPVSGFVIHPFSISKMYSSCYHGSIRLMDVEKEVFDLVYSSEDSIYSISQNLCDVKSLYIGEGYGGINMWDVRSGKSSFSCDLHENRINSIDFNSGNENIMVTSSTDRTACIWDLRQINADKPVPLKTITHKRALSSAYFSPSGKCLATTSADDKVGFSSGANYEDTSTVYHNNKTGRWLSTFRGIWGWDDSSVFIGNMNRGVDVISVKAKRIVATLESDLMSAIPCRFDAHPYNAGMLASATSGGQVYLWTLP